MYSQTLHDFLGNGAAYIDVHGWKSESKWRTNQEICAESGYWEYRLLVVGQNEPTAKKYTLKMSVSKKHTSKGKCRFEGTVATGHSIFYLRL